MSGVNSRAVRPAVSKPSVGGQTDEAKIGILRRCIASFPFCAYSGLSLSADVIPHPRTLTTAMSRYQIPWSVSGSLFVAHQRPTIRIPQHISLPAGRRYRNERSN